MENMRPWLMESRGYSMTHPRPHCHLDGRSTAPQDQNGKPPINEIVRPDFHRKDEFGFTKAATPADSKRGPCIYTLELSVAA